MYAFTQHRPATVRQAASLLAKEEEAKLLAGGHTLIPTMKLRLAGPKHIVDLSKVEGLKGIEMTGRSLIIGAMTPHVEVATSAVVKEQIPALADLAGKIGDPAVRHRGTIGGSIANTIPTPTIPPGGWGSAPPSSPTSGAFTPTNSSRACSKPHSSPTRSSPRCSFRR